MSQALGRQNHKINCFCVSGDGLTSSITAQGLLDGVKHVWNSHSFFTKDLEYRWVCSISAWDRRRIGQILGYLVLK